MENTNKLWPFSPLSFTFDSTLASCVSYLPLSLRQRIKRYNTFYSWLFLTRMQLLSENLRARRNEQVPRNRIGTGPTCCC